MNDVETLEWITIFRVDEDDGNDRRLYNEIEKESLREG